MRSRAPPYANRRSRGITLLLLARSLTSLQASFYKRKRGRALFHRVPWLKLVDVAISAAPSLRYPHFVVVGRPFWPIIPRKIVVVPICSTYQGGLPSPRALRRRRPQRTIIPCSAFSRWACRSSPLMSGVRPIPPTRTAKPFIAVQGRAGSGARAGHRTPL